MIAAKRSRSPKPSSKLLMPWGCPKTSRPRSKGVYGVNTKLLGRIFGVMFPPLFGCRTNAELCRVRGWDKNLPSRVLSALPKRSWIKRLRRLGLEVLVPRV